jgi:hypothetical protein
MIGDENSNTKTENIYVVCGISCARSYRTLRALRAWLLSAVPPGQNTFDGRGFRGLRGPRSVLGNVQTPDASRLKREDDLETPDWKCPSGSREFPWAYIDSIASVL